MTAEARLSGADHDAEGKCYCNYCRLGVPPDATGRQVWDALLSRPGVTEALERARQDFAAGRFVKWKDVRS